MRMGKRVSVLAVAVMLLGLFALAGCTATEINNSVEAYQQVEPYGIYAGGQVSVNGTSTADISGGFVTSASGETTGTFVFDSEESFGVNDIEDTSEEAEAVEAAIQRLRTAATGDLGSEVETISGNLDGLSLNAGVYDTGTGTVHLDGGVNNPGVPNPAWEEFATTELNDARYFILVNNHGDFLVSQDSSMTLDAGPDEDNIPLDADFIWNVDGDVTIADNAIVRGTIYTPGNITVGNNVQVFGRLIAGGNVTVGDDFDLLVPTRILGTISTETTSTETTIPVLPRTGGNNFADVLPYILIVTLGGIVAFVAWRKNVISAGPEE